MDRTQVISGLAADLHATEQAVDAAIGQATTLVQTMIGARAALSVSPVAGAGSQAKAMETIAALGVAREAIVACHAELQRDHRKMGWGVYAVGPVDKPDDWETPVGGTPPTKTGHLRVAS